MPTEILSEESIDVEGALIEAQVTSESIIALADSLIEDIHNGPAEAFLLLEAIKSCAMRGLAAVSPAIELLQARQLNGAGK